MATRKSSSKPAPAEHEPTISLLHHGATKLETAAYRLEAARDTLKMLRESMTGSGENLTEVSVLFGVDRLLEEAQELIELSQVEESGEASHG